MQRKANGDFKKWVRNTNLITWIFFAKTHNFSVVPSLFILVGTGGLGYLDRFGVK